MVHRTVLRSTISMHRLRKTVAHKPQTSSILHARHSNIFPPSAKPKKAGVTRGGRRHPRRSRWWVAATHNGHRHPVVAMSARTAAVKYLHGKPWYIAWVFRAPEGNRYEAILKGERIATRDGRITKLHKYQLLGTNDQPPSVSSVRRYEALGTVAKRHTGSTNIKTSSAARSHHSSSRHSTKSSHRSSGTKTKKNTTGRV